MTASRSGSLASVKMLLAHGADPNAKEKWLQETALMWAAAEDHADVVAALAAAGANLDQKSWVTDTPTLLFPESGGPNIPFPKGGWTAAMYAARQNAKAALAVLAEKGANLNLQDPQGATAMHLAIINLHYDAAALLLDKGADPNIADETGMTALYAVANMDTLGWIQGRPAPALESNAEYDAAGLVNKLIDHGANPNPRLKRAILKRHHDFLQERDGRFHSADARGALRRCEAGASAAGPGCRSNANHERRHQRVDVRRRGELGCGRRTIRG
jgi:ankyrin repeat protein